MKIITYSDLHLEFGTNIKPPANGDADVMILAGDIITFKDYSPISRFLNGWQKPVLYIAGNHEYYTQRPIAEEKKNFKLWLDDNHKNVTFLQDEEISIDGVHFFGGTMWTNFNNADIHAMIIAQQQMNDYRLIITEPGKSLKPIDTISFHETFVSKLTNWLDKEMEGPRVVISHHAPAVNPNTKYGSSPLMPAFNSLDMLPIIEKYQPHLWIYGHTHECDNQMLGKTRVISNQLGYPGHFGSYECKDFNADGLPIVL